MLVDFRKLFSSFSAVSVRPNVISLNSVIFNSITFLFLEERRSSGTFRKLFVSEAETPAAVSSSNTSMFNRLMLVDALVSVIKVGKPNYGYKVRQSGFFLLTPSPWPLFSSFAAFLMLTGFAAYLNFYDEGLFCFFLGVFFVALAFFFWCRDLIRELTFFGRTSLLIEANIRWAFWLFIVSEALLFFSFFWAFFHSAFEPAIQLGTVWPPLESIQMNSLDIPIANTIFLLASGAALTWTQYALIGGHYREVLLGFSVLFAYAVYFMMSQWHEYVVAFHQVNDSVFGSSMYILTVFHGGHVFIGSLFLFVCLVRFVLGHFKTVSYLGLTLAAWYWHFVDVVWVLVFLWIYLWGTWVPVYFLETFIENLTNI